MRKIILGKILSAQNNSLLEGLFTLLTDFLFFFFNRIYSSTFVFHPDISKNIPKLVLFMLYQGVWWLQHTVKSAFQPLVFIHVIYIRCYETDVAEIAMHTALISLAVYEKGRENKKKLHRYRLQNMRQTVVPSGSHGYLPTRHSSAHRSPVYPSD